MLGHFIEPGPDEISRVWERLFCTPAQRFEMRKYRHYPSGLFRQERTQSTPGGYRAIYGDQRDFDRTVRVVLDRVIFDAEVIPHKTARDFDRRHELVPADDFERVLHYLVESRGHFQVVIFSLEPLLRNVNISLGHPGQLILSRRFVALSMLFDGGFVPD